MAMSAAVLGVGRGEEGEPAGVRYYRTFRSIWEKAAPYMIHGDFYILALTDRTSRGYHAIQFHDEDRGAGFVQVIRNAKCPEERITVRPRQIDPKALYEFESPEFGRRRTVPGGELEKDGFTVSLPARSGEIWFYRRQ
jgi:hypothetical protein